MADITQADIDAAVAEATSGHAAALATARSEGASAERARINDILASDAGKERPKAALSAALKTGMDLETATAFLADLPKEAGNAPRTPAAGAGKEIFDAAMANTANPDLNDEGGEGGEEASAEDAALAQSFGGKKPAAK